MIVALTLDDLVIGRGEGLIGPAIPAELQHLDDSALRFVDGEIIDASARTTWFVDADGLRHVEPGAGRQALTCTLADDLERVDGAWCVADPLVRLKARLKAEIDAEAERQRLCWITPGAGQSIEYQQAAAEATALLGALAAEPEHVPAPSAYPMLAASIGLDGDTLVDVATAVFTLHQQWQAVGSAIRKVRLAAKQAVDLAVDEAAARAVQPIWPAA